MAISVGLPTRWSGTARAPLALPIALVVRRRSLGDDQTRAHCVDPDRLGAELHGQLLGEQLDGALGGGIDPHPGRMHRRRGRGQVDDGTTTLVGHAGIERLATMDRAQQVDPQHVAQVCFGSLEDRTEPPDSRIVDQDVHRADLVGQGLHRLGIAHVTAVRGPVDHGRP